MDYKRFVNQFSSNRKPFLLRELMKRNLASPVPITNFCNGCPNEGTFPYENISIKFKDGRKVSLEGSKLTEALQYNQSDGLAKLITLLTDFQTKLHSPPMNCDWSIAITAGCQDGLSKAFDMLLNPGDYVIGEDYLYSGIISVIKPYNAKHLKVKGDKDGMNPESLKQVLQKWSPEDVRNKVNGVPKILYIVPNGSNPVGTSTTAERRREIYKIAQQYDLLILEDDPYFHIQFNQDQKAPSFLSMDVDGRVLRFDSFSKILSGGMRLGYVTGPKPLVQRMVFHMQVTQMHTSTLAQVVAYETLSMWGLDGYIEYAQRTAMFYKNQRDMMLHYVKKWLTGLAEWNVPVCGLFLWIRVLGLKDTHNLCINRCHTKQVSFLPGSTSTIDDSPTPYLRVAYSIASEEQIDKGFQKLAEAIREELQDKKEQDLNNVIY